MKVLKFSKTHEWALVEGDFATIGITDYAQKSLGDIVFVELPEIGRKLKQNEQFGVVESTKAASELYSPLSGEVIEVNKEVINNPQLINEDPFNKGWMIKIKISNIKELDNLLDQDLYKEFILKEEK